MFQHTPEYSSETLTIKNTFYPDIGNLLNIKHIDDHTKHALLTNHWAPPKDYKFPFSIQIRQGKEKKRTISFSHLNIFHWLVVSDVSKGLFCKFCFLFAPETANNVTLKALVRQPLTKFSKLTGKDGYLTVHNNHQYHINSVVSGNEFLKSYCDPSLSIINQVNVQRLKQVQENRARIKPIIETLILCGRQNFALRGAYDDGNLLNSTSNSLVSNDGNFRELLRFKINSGDHILKTHLETTSSRATYISKTTQNELLMCIGEEIQFQIIEEVKKTKFYSIIFDETTDISHKEQLSLSIRYVLDNRIIEKFLTFVDAYQSILDEDIMSSRETKLTGQALGNIVLNILNQFSII